MAARRAEQSSRKLRAKARRSKHAWRCRRSRGADGARLGNPSEGPVNRNPLQGDSRRPRAVDLPFVVLGRCLSVAALSVVVATTSFVVCACGADSAAIRPSALRISASPALGISGQIVRPVPVPGGRRLRDLSRTFPLLARRSPWSLPPIVSLRANPRSEASYRWLRRRVLRSGRLALSPKARRAIERGRVSRGALAPLLTKPRTGRPLLVFFRQRISPARAGPTLAGTRSREKISE